MNPETIIAELRGINAWRRGGEEIEQPDPKHIGEVLDAAADSLRSLIASNTTLRRERSEARAEVAQLKGALALGQENCDAEYDELRKERDEAKAKLTRIEEYLRNSGRNMDEAQEQIAERDAEIARLTIDRDNWRSYVQELEAERDDYRDRVSGTERDIAAALGEVHSLRSANAELANKLENCMGMLEELEDCNWGDCGMPFTIDWDSLRAALASHAAGEPAKHPDTERLDWLFSAGHLAEFEDRAAIDAARKEVQL